MERDFSQELPSIVRQRANTLGEQGRHWLTGLNALVTDIADKWQLSLGDVLSGGSESLVLNVSTSDQVSAILKLGLPGSSNIACEAKVYDLAAGSGYAELLGLDLSLNAILLERLGNSIESTGMPISNQIETICQTLQVAWLPIDASHGFMTGAEKARWLFDFIQEKWTYLNEPCRRQTLDLALSYAEMRQSAYSPEDSVLVHGDAHGNNTLMVLTEVSVREPEFKFVDPDGLFAERACDLSVLMRDWSDELLDKGSMKTLRARGRVIADLTDVDEEAIWQWGFVERISTGLVLTDIGMKEEGRKMLAVADKISKQL